METTLKEGLRRLLGVEKLRARRLPGGRNNQVYRIDAEGRAVACKRYFRAAKEGRDRQDAEWRFVQFARSRAPQKLPEPLARDNELGLSAFSFIEGRLPSAQIGEAALADAARFLASLNVPPRPPLSRLPDASDACFSPARHVAHARERVEGLLQGGPATSLPREARNFLEDELRPRLDEAAAAFEQRCRDAGVGFRAALGPEQRVVSPSDFGFHNALETKRGAFVYLDFEYAGWDDPLKAVCDFFAQPDFPPPLSGLEGFASALAEEGGVGVDLELARALLPIYVCKWACIVLNPLRSEVAARRDFARRSAAPESVLRRARSYFLKHPALGA